MENDPKKKRKDQEEMVDEKIDESFPASDPPSYTLGPDKPAPTRAQAPPPRP